MVGDVIEAAWSEERIEEDVAGAPIDTDATDLGKHAER